MAAAAEFFSIDNDISKYIVDKGENKYEVDHDKLSEEQVHLFYPSIPCVESVVIAALEYLFFSPFDPEKNKLFEMEIIKLDELQIFAVHFPKKYLNNLKKLLNMKNVKFFMRPEMLWFLLKEGLFNYMCHKQRILYILMEIALEG